MWKRLIVEKRRPVQKHSISQQRAKGGWNFSLTSFRDRMDGEDLTEECGRPEKRENRGCPSFSCLQSDMGRA